jgi:lipoprotein-anchoring transpeptidase ErfK/SrfK
MTRAHALFTALLIPGILTAQSVRRAPVDPRAEAARDTRRRIIVSIERRRLWVVEGRTDTLLAVPVAVGSGKTLSTAARSWTFRTPRGVHTVLAKETDPVWVRPDWAYIEVAKANRLRLEYLDLSRPTTLPDGAVLAVRDGAVAVLTGDAFVLLPLDDEIVFGTVLYVPPIQTLNRRVAGVLGRYRLNLGNGIGIHGTRDSASIGRAVTHGCIRVGDADLEWIYANIVVGTPVYIF